MKDVDKFALVAVGFLVVVMFLNFGIFGFGGGPGGASVNFGYKRVA